MNISTFAWAVIVSLFNVTNGGELHPGLTAKRDWSKSVHQFNLHKHFMTPTAKDHREGISNSRRLARNAIRLGISNETHRKLVAQNPPGGIIQDFDQTLPLPKDGPRVAIDGTSDALPFGDGPGYFPSFPTGTEEFWKDGQGPKAMWEVVACPVADVEAFLENPLRCVFGGDDGSILDFFSTINGDSIKDAMTDAIVPIAVEFIWVFSGLGWLVEILSNVCEILRIIDLVKSAVDALGEFWDSTTDVDKAWWNPLNWFRERHLLDEYGGCTGHLTTCSEDGDIVDEGFANCLECLQSEEQAMDCLSCRTCFQPLYQSVPDMQGLCLSTNSVRSLFTAPAPSLPELHGLYTALTARYIEEKINSEILQAIENSELSINDNTNTAKNEIIDTIDNAENDINANIDSTCSSSRRRLNEDSQPSFDDFMRSEQAQTAKKHAKSQGLKDDAVEEIFSKLLRGETGQAFNNKLQETIKNDFSDPKKMELIEKVVRADVEANQNEYTGRLVSRLLNDSTDKQTRELNVNELRDTISKLQSIKEANQRNLGLVEDCKDLVNTIKEFIKDELLTPLVTEIVSNLASMGGTGSVFQSVLDNTVYSNALADLVNPSTSPLLMSFGFVQAFDPWSEGGVLQIVMGAIVDIFQTIVGFFLYGCDISAADCGDLPSLRNEVLPIKETRDGSIHMGSGCDSEFEGELAWYTPAFDIIDKLLDAAGDAVIEFLNIPIKIVQFILQAAAKLFDHMNNVCGYLDGYVQFVLVEAIHENSRFALQELACRHPYEVALQLQRGYGCDGLDNDCDPDKQIDECEEDIFPPEIDAVEAILHCRSITHASASEAEDCFSSSGLVTATDDCKKVRIEFDHTDENCSTNVLITAIAEGCGERPDEDATVLVVENIGVDSDPPHVECKLGTQKLTGNGAGVFTDLKLTYVAYDTGGKCTDTEDLKVTITVLSNEVVETGEEMVSISEPVHGSIPSVWAENSVCNTGSNGKCKISSPKKSRLYLVQVTGTDNAGNTAMAECSTVVGAQIVNTTDPLFIIAQLDSIGGVEENNLRSALETKTSIPQPKAAKRSFP